MVSPFEGRREIRRVGDFQTYWTPAQRLDYRAIGLVTDREPHRKVSEVASCEWRAEWRGTSFQGPSVSFDRVRGLRT